MAIEKRTKIVDEVKKIIDSRNPDKDLGRLKINTSPKVFQFKTPNIISDPDNPKTFNNIKWSRTHYQYNRGAFVQFKSVADFTNTLIPTGSFTIDGVNGNFIDRDFFREINVLYRADIEAESAFDHQLFIKNSLKN